MKLRTTNVCLQVITENQERFVQMLNEPESGGGGGGGGAGGVAPGGPAGARGSPGAESGYIQVTPEEKLAIDRVCTLYCLVSSISPAYYIICWPRTIYISNLQMIYIRNLQMIYIRNLQMIYIGNLQINYNRNLQMIYIRNIAH